MLVAALSQLYVAFTLEFDDVLEQRMPHRTARGPAAGSDRGPWLISRAMWANHLRWLPTTGDGPLSRLTNPAGLRRWGYLAEDGSLRRGGELVNRVAAPITAEVEGRWEERFGGAVAGLRAALRPLSDPALPWALPVVGRRSTTTELGGWASAVRGADDELPTLLARALIRVAAAHEERSNVPLQFAADALRVIGPDGIRRRDLPGAAGISREAAATSVAWLAGAGLLTPGERLALTDRGVRAQTGFAAIAARVDAAPAFAGIEAAAGALLVQTDALAATVTPHPGSWRAHPPYASATRALVADPRGRLPWFPMVLHRGGFPDGS